MNKKFEHICSFEKKLQLFQTQLTNYPSLAVRKAKMPDLDSSKYAESVGKLCAEFTSRFADFRKCETEFKLFSQPFNMAPEGSTDYYQMELIYLQSDMDLRRTLQQIAMAWLLSTKIMYVEISTFGATC